jgi:hypothetical protein
MSPSSCVFAWSSYTRQHVDMLLLQLRFVLQSFAFQSLLIVYKLLLLEGCPHLLVSLFLVFLAFCAE